jgi:hypothetical protein
MAERINPRLSREPSLDKIPPAFFAFMAAASEALDELPIRDEPLPNDEAADDEETPPAEPEQTIGDSGSEGSERSMGRIELG